MRVRRSIPALVAFLTYVLLDTDSAFAWGPATHAKLATDVLSQLPMLPAAVAAILSRYGMDFVFGNIAADVVFAKRLSKIKQFCHHWSTGFRFLELAKDDCDRAFAFGYLSHLAADTVAHGRYVPRQLSITSTPPNLGHVYWESRADALVDRHAWETLEEISVRDYERHHEILESQLHSTLLPYHLNRRFFERLNRVVVHDYWLRCMDVLQQRSKRQLCRTTLQHYHEDALSAMRSVLSELERSPVLREDPNGTAALAQARHHRKENRRLRRRGVCTAKRTSEFAAGFAPNARPLPGPCL